VGLTGDRLQAPQRRPRAPGAAGSEPPAVVVLAAGRGTRLGQAAAGVPKWLVPVNGTPIAHFHLAALRAAPAAWSRLVAVTGHGSGVLDEAGLSRLAGRRCELVHNPDYAVCNNWLSLARALDHLDASGWTGGVCVVNSDLLLPPIRLRALLEHARARRRESVLAIDSRRALTEEAMKVAVAGDGTVSDIGKGALRGQAAGEYIGASVLAAGHVAELRRILAGFGRDPARRDEWYEAAYREAIDRGVAFSVFEVATDDWIEIDDERDLRLAAEIAKRYAA
jgi:choline kinase